MVCCIVSLLTLIHRPRSIMVGEPHGGQQFNELCSLGGIIWFAAVSLAHLVAVRWATRRFMDTVIDIPVNGLRYTVIAILSHSAGAVAKSPRVDHLDESKLDHAQNDTAELLRGDLETIYF